MTTPIEDPKIQVMDKDAEWLLITALAQASLSGVKRSLTIGVHEAHRSFRQEFSIKVNLFGELERCSATVAGTCLLPKDPTFDFAEVEACVHRTVMRAIQTYNWVQACEEALQRCLKGEQYGASAVVIRHCTSPANDGSLIGTRFSISGPDYIRAFHLPIEVIETYKSDEWEITVERIAERLSGMLHDHTEVCKSVGLYKPARTGPAIFEDILEGKFEESWYPKEVTVSLDTEPKPSLRSKICKWFKKEKKYV